MGVGRPLFRRRRRTRTSTTGHDLLNLRVGWSFATNWSTTLRLNNVTDRAYADRADFAFGNYRYFPGRGRTLFVEVSYGAS